MANDVFRFYADEPEFVFSYLRNHWRNAVVRWDGRKVGASNMWLMVVVLDQSAAVAAFRSWLSEHGTIGDPLIRKWPFPRIMTVSNTIVVKRRRRILSWHPLRALRTGGL